MPDPLTGEQRMSATEVQMRRTLGESIRYAHEHYAGEGNG